MTTESDSPWLDLLMQLTQRISGSESLSETLVQLARIAQEFTRADIISLFAVNPITRKFQPLPAIVGELYSDSPEYMLPLRADGVADYVLKQESIFVESVDEMSQYQTEFVRAERIHSFASLALKTNNPHRPLGIIYISYRTPHAFSSAEREELSSFASATAAILRNTWFLQRYREIARIGREINQDLRTVESLFLQLHRHLAGIMDVSDFLLLAEFRPQSRRLDMHMFEDGKYEFLPDQPYEGGCQWVLENRQLIHIRSWDDKEAEQWKEILIDIPGTIPNKQSLVFVPVLFRGDVPLAALSVQHSTPNTYDKEDLQLLEALSNHLSLALSNIRLFEGLGLLNLASQSLTQQLDTKTLLQDVADETLRISGADLVILFRYLSDLRRFDLPPVYSGSFLVPEFPLPTVSHPDDMATLAFDHGKFEFARDSHQLFEIIGGDPSKRRGSIERREKIASSAAIPLIVAKKNVGVIFINFRQPQKFDAPQKELIQSLANYAAIAINNAELFERASERRIRELEQLQEIDRRISASLDLQDVLDKILDAATEQIAAEDASILLLNPDGRTLRTAAAHGPHQDISTKQVVSLDEDKGIAGWVFRNQQPVCVGNMPQSEWRTLYIPVSGDALSELDVPILYQDRAIGVIRLLSPVMEAFSSDDQHFLEVLAGQVAVAIKNAEQYSELQESKAWVEALREIDKTIVQSVGLQHLNDVLQLVLEMGMDLTGSERGNIMWYDPVRNDLEMRAVKGESLSSIGTRQRIGEGIVGLAAQKRKSYNVADIEVDPWSTIYLRLIPGMRSELAVPLTEGDNLLGVLNLEHPTVGAYGSQSQERVEALARQAVIAIQSVSRFVESEAKQQRLLALLDVDEKIIGQLDDPQIAVETILRYAMELIGAEAGDFHLYSDDRVTATFFGRIHELNGDVQVERIDQEDAVARIKRGIVRLVAETRRPYLTIGDVQEDPNYAGEEGEDIHSEIAVPLVANDEQLLGVLNLESRHPYAFHHGHLEILELFVSQAVIALQNARFSAETQSARRRFEILTAIGRRLLDAAATRRHSLDCAG